VEGGKKYTYNLVDIIYERRLEYLVDSECREKTIQIDDELFALALKDGSIKKNRSYCSNIYMVPLRYSFSIINFN